MKTSSIAPATLFFTAVFAAVPAGAATYAPWLTQIGVSDSILSAANWGRGQILGIVDTGIVANSPVFASGQVSASLSTCAAVSFRCSNGVTDDNSHGTAVASIAAANRPSPYTFSTGGYTITAGSLIGVAPNANIVAEKVLSAAGSGYSTDVANGLKKAADAGATVINLSLTFGNSSDLVAAINYAAGKGAFIVWAGGNSAQALLNGANTNGLTAAAISHLVLAGSVSPKNTLSSFSNTPGSGGLVNTSNVKTNYSARWIEAPGESILAPSVTGGSGAWGSWSGTSMAAPVVSESLMLLQSAWPILRTNGTTANLLLATATDLGSKGVDATYGNGLVNLATAFQPYGALSVTQANGKTVAVSSLTGALISGGALGTLSSVQSKLAGYTAFDTYARNYSVNLSGLIKAPASGATLNPLPSNTNTGPVAMKLADGGEIAYMPMATTNSASALGVFGATTDDDKRIGYAMLTDRAGNTTAFGYGYSVQHSYARALYGSDTWARLAAETGGANLANLAQGGGLFAYGTPLNVDTRIAFSWSTSASPIEGQSITPTPAWAALHANNVSLGLSHRFTERLTGGFNLGSLNETHGLLGTTYDAGSTMSLGDSHRSTSVGFSLAVLLDPHSRLFLETAFASTRGGEGTGLFASASDLRARAQGMTYQRTQVFQKDDNLTLSVKQPLRLVSGNATLVMPAVNADTGVASFNRETVSLVPTGRETDYRIAYSRPLADSQTLSLEANMKRDVYHLAGNNESGIGLTWAMKF